MVVKTTRITIETETLMILRRAQASSARCPECRAEVDVISLDKGSLTEPDTAAHIREWLGTGKLHLWAAGLYTSANLRDIALAMLRFGETSE